MEIYIVGIGPGSAEDMSFRARAAIEKADVIVGYGLYVKLIEDIIKGKEIFSTSMTHERERCEKAAELALSGKTVAVISGGDAGVYGMAGLMYEVCEAHPEIEIETVPGITAACSGAAVAGAPLGHDFAVISLSDMLTPWELIEKRLRLASEADMVICIYNPASHRRADHLKRACAIVMEHKTGSTPCAYVRNIGRDGESCRVCTLEELSDAPADMFTTVYIGSSTTRIINGRLITPRGYRER